MIMVMVIVVLMSLALLFFLVLFHINLSDLRRLIGCFALCVHVLFAFVIVQEDFKVFDLLSK